MHETHKFRAGPSDLLTATAVTSDRILLWSSVNKSAARFPTGGPSHFSRATLERRESQIISVLGFPAVDHVFASVYSFATLPVGRRIYSAGGKASHAVLNAVGQEAEDIFGIMIRGFLSCRSSGIWVLDALQRVVWHFRFLRLRDRARLGHGRGVCRQFSS